MSRTPLKNSKVPKASSSSGIKHCGWNFTHWEQDSARMNIINMPLADSQVFKKMLAAKESDLADGKKANKRPNVSDAIQKELFNLGIACSAKKARTDVPSSSASASASDGNGVQDLIMEQMESLSNMVTDKQKIELLETDDLQNAMATPTPMGGVSSTEDVSEIAARRLAMD